MMAELEPLWEQGVYTDFVELIRTEAEAWHFHPIYLDMSVEGEILYDPQGFLEEILQEVRQRLKALGARRRSLGRISYWDLKPQFTPGEVIEL